MKKSLFFFIILGMSSMVMLYTEPYWWNNPHHDDDYDMYQRGSASGCQTEQKAVETAVQNAKKLIITRIGIEPALKEAGLPADPRYAITNFELQNTLTEKQGKRWNAWVLLKYPQTEKESILSRWKTSVASITELKQEEKLIPVQFGLLLRTVHDKREFLAGEAVEFSVNSEKDCYLLLLDHQSDGTTVILFPNRFHPDGFIRGGKRLNVPDPSDHAFEFSVGAPFGDDRIEAVAVTDKNALYEKYSGLVHSLAGQTSMAVSSRGIFVTSLHDSLIAQSNTTVLWSHTELTISTYAVVDTY